MSGRESPSELRLRAARIRRHASFFADMAFAAQLRTFADELEARAGDRPAVEEPSTQDNTAIGPSG